jgi:hypothetical protein
MKVTLPIAIILSVGLIVLAAMALTKLIGPEVVVGSISTVFGWVVGWITPAPQSLRKPPPAVIEE